MLNKLHFSVALGILLGLALTTASPAVRAEEPAHQHATEAATTKFAFKGDAYLLGTDPVTGENLPEKPIIYQHEGRELRFSNQQNVDTFKANPTKYLPKVDEQMIKMQMPFYPLDTCLVTGEKLNGDMGKPVDMIYKNRLVRFCCNSCPKDFKKDPDKFISKLNDAVIAKQATTYPMTSCPVSEDKLGGDMGKPVDLVVGNRLVRLCCGGCVKDFNKSPLKFIKLIDDAAKKSTP